MPGGALSHIKSILVLEDEAMILWDIESTLLDSGVANVVAVTTLDAALAACEQNDFDAALLDLHIGSSGWSYEVAQRLRSSGVPVVFSSGSAGLAADFAELALVKKPFSGDQLVAALLESAPSPVIAA